MFDPNYELRSGRRFQWTYVGLTVLSLVSLTVTIWILTDLPRERQILEHLTRHLPETDLPEVNHLAGEMKLQSRLGVLLVVNLIASTTALTLLSRAYINSQRSLRNAHVLATDILDSLDQGVITTDREAVILSINPRGRELLEVPRDGTGLAPKSFPPDHKPLEQMCREVIHHQQHIPDRAYVSRKNGIERYLRAGCSLLRDHDGQHRGTVIHIRDATEITLMEQRLRRMERYMGLGSLAAGLQHEIKNPLSALSLHVQLLQESFSTHSTSPAIQESLGVLSTEVRRITDVLENFRDFASIAKLNRAETDIRQLVEKMVMLKRPEARRQGINIETVFPEKNIPPISIDAVRIEQVLLNLILNALAAMTTGGTMTIRLRSQSDSVDIDVADTGCGIPDDLRDKVFDPYFTTRSNGTGMGLALCEKIVRQHEGTIHFNSGPQGTVFTVTLPRNVTT